MKSLRRKPLFWFLLVVVAAILLVLYFLFLAPSANSLIIPDVQYSQNYSSVAYKTVESQVIKDLGYKNTLAGLVRKDGNFYEFSLSAADNSPGGIALIAHMRSDGHFEKVWDGQDAPDCYFINKYQVPVDIAPWCNATVQIDRSNPVRSLFSMFGF